MQDATPLTFADRIRMLMLPDETQESLAARVGRTQSTVNEWLSGKIKCPQPSTLEAIGRNLGVSPGWLRNGKGPPRPYVIRGDVPLGDELAANLEHAKRLDLLTAAASPYETMAETLESLIQECDDRKAQYEAMLAKIHREVEQRMGEPTGAAA